MADAISWFKTYSPPFALLLIIVSGVALVLKQVVAKQIDRSFIEIDEAIKLRLGRRSAFEEQVITQRFTLITELSNRLHTIFFLVQRASYTNELPEDVYHKHELLPLTQAYQDLQVNRLATTLGVLETKASLRHKVLMVGPFTPVAITSCGISVLSLRCDRSACGRRAICRR